VAGVDADSVPVELVGGQRFFITNSHCTNEQGSLEGTGYGQPLLSASGVIATEVADPEYFRRGCYASFLCRYSDASRAAYAAGTPSTLGSIARTPAPNAQGDANLRIAGEFHISAEDLNTEYVVGSELNKVGRTTGWTRGPVTLTCVDVLQSGSRSSSSAKRLSGLGWLVVTAARRCLLRRAEAT
jgi:hypothetical protein